MQHFWFGVIIVTVLTLSENGLVHGQACSSEDITESEWEWGIENVNIDASHKGTIAEYRMNNTVSITTESSGFSRKYIDATLENNILRIFTTDAFATYEDRETALQIQLRITFVCASPPTRWFVFYQGINSANNHDPEFSESVYEIPVKLPLPKGFDLTFYKEVFARDIDLEHNQVRFHSPASSFIDVGTSDRIGDDKKTFYATLVLNQQLLTLTEPFSFTIIATDSGLPENRSATANIHIVPDAEATYSPSPRFQKALYRGSISETGEFSCETPTIEEDSYSDELSFTLSGDDGDLFSVELLPPFSVSVALKPPITEENYAGKTFLTATISANHPEVFSGSTVLLIDLPNVPIVTTPRPAFEKSLFRGSVNSQLELNVEPIILTINSYTADTTFSMTGDNSSAFVLSNEGNVITITFREPQLGEELESIDFYSFVVTATNPISGVGETAVLISLPPKVCEGTQITDQIISSTTTSSVDVTTTAFSTSVDVSSSTLTTSVDTTSSTLTTSVSVETTEKDSSFSTSIECETIDFTTAFSTLIDSETTDETIEYTTRVDIETTEKNWNETVPETTKGFTIKSTEFGRIGYVLATSLSSDGVIEYSIRSESAYFLTKLSIDSFTGEISLLDEMNSGYYEAEVMAKISIDGEDFQSTSLVQLTVMAVTTCPDGNTTVGKTLAIQYLKENEIHRNIISTKIDGCSYIIRSVNPNDKSYVTINEETNMLESISFDREDSIFNEYEVPQIQIKLKLECSGDTPSTVNRIERFLSSPSNVTQIRMSRSIDPSLSDGRWYAVTNDIDFTTDLTIINIIIEDVNDNFPIFDATTPTLIGYPEPEIANHKIPSHVAVVRATDLDASWNAKIRYSLSDNHLFQINPNDGTITPLGDGWSFVDSAELTIHATDLNGASTGLSVSHVLHVRKLRQQHLTVEDVVEQLNAESAIKILVLQSAIVPHLPISSRMRQGGPLSAIRMIVYAFGDNGEPLITTQVQRQLDPLVGSRQLTYTSYEEFVDSEDDDDDTTVWIIAVGVMACIILLSLISIFLMWWYKIRPYEYKTMTVDDSVAVSQENLQGYYPDSKVESSPPLSRLEAEKRESVNISGSTDMESTDEPSNSKRTIQLLNLLDGDEEAQGSYLVDESEKRERKKSQGVTFNELVERIDIETDPVRDSDTDLRR